MNELQKNALHSILNALDHGRAKRNIDDQFAWILLMLLWAKWIPQTTKEGSEIPFSFTATIKKQ